MQVVGRVVSVVVSVAWAAVCAVALHSSSSFHTGFSLQFTVFLIKGGLNGEGSQL